MKRAQAFPSTYLSKEDVPHPTQVQIADVRPETIKGDNGDEEKAVMHFAGKNLKPMILNNTNWLAIETAYGDESDGWRGKTIEIYIDPGVMFGGKRVGGLRVRVPMNGHTNGSPWDVNTALANAAAVGITREDLKAAATARGFTGFQPVRDTPWIKEMIAAKGIPDADFATSPVGEEIPF